MDVKIFKQNEEIVQKIVNRIRDSKSFYKGQSFWKFDDQLFIDRYNGLYKITFKNATLGHYHSDDKSFPEYNKFHDMIFDALKDKETEVKNLAISTL